MPPIPSKHLPLRAPARRSPWPLQAAQVLLAALLAALLAICFAPSLTAQNGNALTAQTAQAVQLDFTTIHMADSEAELYYNDGNGFRPVSLRPFANSAPHRYRGPSALQIYRKAPVQQEPPYTVVGSAQLPTGTSNVQLLLIPLADGNYQILAQSNDKDSLPQGTARIYNASNQPIAIRAGDAQPVVLRPGEQLLSTGNGVNLSLQAAINQSGEWQMARNSIFTLKPNHRLSIFLTTSDSDVFRARTFDGSLTDVTPLQVFSIRN